MIWSAKKMRVASGAVLFICSLALGAAFGPAVALAAFITGVLYFVLGGLFTFKALDERGDLNL